MGWLMFEDESREVVALFMPTVVRFVARVDDDEEIKTFEFKPELEVN